MELNLVVPENMSMQGGAVSLSDVVFGCEFNEPLVHQVVTAYMAAGRAGTRAQKSRSEVSGGGIKPWRQKGTGRARVGTIRSPLWRKGGVTFAAKPQNYEQKVNKKMYKGAMRAIFSELIRQNRLIVVEKFAVATPKTKELVSKLKNMGLNQVLIIANEVDENLYFAARNLYKVDVRDFVGVDPVSLVGFEKVLIESSVLKRFEEILG